MTSRGLPTTQEVLADMERHRGTGCRMCNTPVSGREAVMSIAMGFRQAPRCLTCLAVTFQRARDDFHAYVLEYIRSRACYNTAWERAEILDGPVTGMENLPQPAPEPDMTGDESADEKNSPILEWDAADMQCADLVMELRLKLKVMKTGEVLKVRATDPAAMLDLPAWCRISRHRLLRVDPPAYWIQAGLSAED